MVVEIGAKTVGRRRKITSQRGEVAIPRDLFADIVRHIDRPTNEAKPNMTAESSYTRPRQAIAIPEARPERCHRTLERPNSA
jgi:hypothetical protein